MDATVELTRMYLQRVPQPEYAAEAPPNLEINQTRIHGINVSYLAA